MLEDDFLKEKQNIREKMLRYSRAVNQGRPLDEEFKEEFSSDDILKRRFKNKKKFFLDDFDKPKDSKSSNIYLKEDLINVKLEEKQSLASKILSRLDKKKERKRSEKLEKRAKKIFNFFQKEKKENGRETLEKPNLREALKESKDVKGKHAHSRASFKGKDAEQIKNKIQNLQRNPQVKNSGLKVKAKSDKTAKKYDLRKNQESVKIASEDNERAKNTLLEGYSAATEQDKNLNFSHLLFAVLLVSFALFLFVPQIYIRNQIYYLSREIGTLRAEESVLYEESKDLKRKLENMRFQNQILDYLE